MSEQAQTSQSNHLGEAVIANLTALETDLQGVGAIKGRETALSLSLDQARSAGVMENMAKFATLSSEKVAGAVERFAQRSDKGHGGPGR